MIDSQKKEFRKKVRELKKHYSDLEKKEKSLDIFRQVEELEAFHRAEVVMLYWSMSDEVFTHDFVEKWYGKKEIILPSVDGENLVLKKYAGRDNLVVGDSFGIGEPDGEEYKNPEKIELIFIPGVAFDKQNNRLGRGKAYYDKLLKTSGAKKIGLCFDFQYFDSVPVDEHDIKMDMVIRD